MLQQDRLRRSVSPLLLQGMQGLGDNLYQRAVLKYCGTQVALQTPWPQMYADLPNVTCVPANSHLRTQRKSEQRSRSLFGRVNGMQRAQRWHLDNAERPGSRPRRIGGAGGRDEHQRRQPVRVGNGVVERNAAAHRIAR